MIACDEKGYPRLTRNTFTSRGCSPKQQPSEWRILRGDRLLVHSLCSQVELNGRIGFALDSVESTDEEDRISVLMREGSSNSVHRSVKVKLRNLQPSQGEQPMFVRGEGGETVWALTATRSGGASVDDLPDGIRVDWLSVLPAFENEYCSHKA